MRPALKTIFKNKTDGALAGRSTTLGSALLKLLRDGVSARALAVAGDRADHFGRVK